MERIQALIAKLNQQFATGAEPAQLLATVQQLQNELSQLQPRGPKTLGTSKVAVTMPSGMSPVPAEYERYLPKTKPAEERVREIKEVKETVLVDNTVSVVNDHGQLDMVFDPMTEIPTLSHQLQETHADNNRPAMQSESLNDKLKQVKTELFEVLKETPIKDLRKAIGINDRFVFIDDLFRGDEAMYERSIKTINSFNIHAEADYWIIRELKVKLGWDNENKTVQHFDQLVRRRFS
ncbi:MAG TPA: hypothetical protein VFI06_11605 [Chitinophagaceae bacterium]|nr:hypothetical protein [Chitinophagaceae bacterium]